MAEHTDWEALLQKYNVERSSFHGAANSVAETPMAESSRKIRDMCTKIIDKLQEEIDASESMNIALPGPDELLPSTEPIEARSVADEDSVRWLATTESFFGIHGTPPTMDVQIAFGLEVKLETAPSPSRTMAAIPLLEPSDAGSSSEWRCTTDPPWPEVVWTRSMRKCLSHDRLNNPTPSPLPKPPDWTYYAVANTPPPPEPPDMSSCMVEAMLAAEECDSWFVFGDVEDTSRNLIGEAQGQSNGTPSGLLNVIRVGVILCFCVSVLLRKKIKLKMKKKSLSLKLKTSTITSNFKWLSPQNDMVLLSNNPVSSFGLFTTLDVSLVLLIVIQLSSYTVWNDLIMTNQNMHHPIELNGRLRDFGLTRLYNQGIDPQTTYVVGTLGYLAPKLGKDYRSVEVELVLKLGLLCSHYEPLTKPSICQVVQYLEREMPLPNLNLKIVGREGVILFLLERLSCNIESREVSLSTLVKLVGYHANKDIIAASGGGPIILDLMLSPQFRTFIFIKCSKILEALSSNEDEIEFLVDGEWKQLELDSVSLIPTWLNKIKWSTSLCGRTVAMQITEVELGSPLESFFSDIVEEHIAPKFHVLQLLTYEHDIVLALQYFNFLANPAAFKHTQLTHHIMLHRVGCNYERDRVQNFRQQMQLERVVCAEKLFICMINSYRRVGWYDEALNFFYWIPEFGCKFTVKIYNHLLEALLGENRFKWLSSLYNNMKGEGLVSHVLIYSIFLKPLCKNGKVDGLCQLQVQMSNEGCFPHDACYTTIISYIYKCGQMDKTKELSLRFTLVQPVYNALIHGVCHEYSIKEVFNLKNAMVEKGVETNVASYSIFIGFSSDMGSIDLSLVVCAQMLVIGCSPNILTFKLNLHTSFYAVFAAIVTPLHTSSSNLALVYVVMTVMFEVWVRSSQLNLVGANLIVLTEHSKKWDPGGNGYFFWNKGSLQFKQWDPGGGSLVHWEGQLDLEATWKDATITQLHCPNSNLEDKVDFNGGGNVMISIEKGQVSKMVVTEKAKEACGKGVRG